MQDDPPPIVKSNGHHIFFNFYFDTLLLNVHKHNTQPIICVKFHRLNQYIVAVSSRFNGHLQTSFRSVRQNRFRGSLRVPSGQNGANKIYSHVTRLYLQHHRAHFHVPHISRLLHEQAPGYPQLLLVSLLSARCISHSNMAALAFTYTFTHHNHYRSHHQLHHGSHAATALIWVRVRVRVRVRVQGQGQGQGQGLGLGLAVINVLDGATNKVWLHVNTFYWPRSSAIVPVDDP